MSMAEVLVALFILALGTIGVLTLFPLGMIQMGQALKDDRTAQCAAQADGYMRSYWKQFVIQNPGADPSMFGPSNAFDNPNAGVAPAFQIPAATPLNGATPSYPVFFDPMGTVAPWQAGPSFTFWVAGQGSGTAVPRRGMTQIPGIERACSLMDGLGYNTSGGANVIGSSFDRDTRYNWLWVLQRPTGAAAGVVSMTIVVFDKRAFQFAPPGAEVAFNPIANGASGNVGSTSVSFGVDPGVQKGGWIADLTVIPSSMVMNANFYRVVSSTPNGLGATGQGVDLELQQPIQDTNASPPATSRVFVILSGVSEVFQRPVLTGQ
jgi:hypothetical protein